MLQLSKNIVREEIEELQYKGYERETVYDTKNEFHLEALNEVKYNSIERITNILLDKAGEQIDNTQEGDFLWDLIYSNISERVEKEVYDILRKYL